MGEGGEPTGGCLRRSPGTRHRAIWLAAFVAFALACLGFWGLSVWQDRTATLRDATARTAAVADLLREHAGRAMEAGDHIVRTTAYLAAAWDLREQEAGWRIWEEIRERVADSPQTASAWIVDAKGDAVLDTWDYPSKAGNFAHRDYYRAHLGPERGLFIGAADRGTTTGRPRFTLSRAIRAEDGRLKGVAVAGVYSDYFAGVYGEAGLPPDAVLALLTAEGDVLAEWPIDDTPAADELSLPTLLERRAAAPGGAFTVDGAGEARLVAYRALADRPLIVAVSSPVAGALAEWRARTWRSGALAFAGLGGFALLVATGVGAARREATAHGESEARLRLALQAGRMGVWDRDGDINTVRWDAAQYEICGMDPREPPLMGDAFFDRLVHPDDREGVRRAMEAAVRAGRDYAHEFRIVRPDGEVRWLAGRGTVIGGGGGGGSGRMIGVNYDITERKRAEEQRELLLAELNHRINNAFTVVQALAVQTFRHGGQDIAEVERAFLDRLGALARVSTLLAVGDGADRADLSALAEAVLRPHRRDDGNPRLSGPAVALPAPMARTLSLALHELATNAAKYGALSVPEGRVELVWRVVGDGGHRRRLVLEWAERDGPTVRRPERRGLGRVLIEQAVAHELDGTVRLEFPPNGVRCRIEVPLDE